VKCDCGWECGVLYVKRLGSKNSLSPGGSGYFSSQTAVTLHTYSPMNMERAECSETLTFKLQTPGNNPKENIRHPVWSYNEETAPLLWAETYVHLVLRLLHLAVIVRTNRLDIRNPKFVHTLYLCVNFPIQYSLIGHSNGSKLFSARYEIKF
jgi:hypothetical protein